MLAQATTTNPSPAERAPGTFDRLSTGLSYQALRARVRALESEIDELGAARDRQALETRRLSERLAALLATLPAGVIVLDESGVIRQSNAAAAELLGQSESIEGMSWSAVVASAFEPSPAPNGDSVTRRGRRVTTLSSSAGADAGRILLLADVTETRALERLVERNERLSAMGKMAASLAHQVRTPLAGALLYFSQCRSSVDNDRAAKLLERGIDRLHEMNRLVQDMLVFARGSGPGERVRIAELFRDVHETVAGLLPPGAHLIIDGTDALREIEGNRVALVAALTNLVNNALEAGPDVVVTLKARVTGERVELVVADNGPGIAPAIRSRIFEPFFSTRPTGTGLGLAVAKTVAEAHGGGLTLASELDHGTVVGLALPAHASVCQRIGVHGAGESA